MDQPRSPRVTRRFQLQNHLPWERCLWVHLKADLHLPKELHLWVVVAGPVGLLWHLYFELYGQLHFEAATRLASSFWSLLDCGGVACCAVIYKQQAGLPEHQHGLDHPLWPPDTISSRRTSTTSWRSSTLFPRGRRLGLGDTLVERSRSLG